jgi:TonB family protein
MPTLVATAGGVTAVPARAHRRFPSIIRPEEATHGPGKLLSTILTTSICLHLLLVGYLGFGVPAELPRLRVVHAPPPPPAIIENIQLEAPPPPKAAREILKDQPQPKDQDLPAPTAAIAAVPSSVSVAFAIRVVGPVRLVSDTGEASGASLAATAAAPEEASGHSLLTPMLNYPPEALLRRLTGRVVVEFHTTARGDIVDARVRAGSGYDVLDRAALENLSLSRWVGEAGYFTKTYEFVLR